MFSKLKEKEKENKNPVSNLSAKEIFDQLKESKITVDDEALKNFETSCIIQAKKFLDAGQKKALERLLFLKECVPKERELLKLGINQFIYKDDVLDFLARREIIESDIKLIELSDYVRPIPDEILETKKKTEGLFDMYYVMFTDYSGTIEKEAVRTSAIKKKEKDPILFGTFQKIDKTKSMATWTINDRLYVLGDWIDEYCDLTLDKFIQLTSEETVKTFTTPETINDIVAELERYQDNGRLKEAENKAKKKFFGTFFKRVRSFLNGK